MTGQAEVLSNASLTTAALATDWRGTGLTVWGAIFAMSICFLLLGHDYDRSALADDGFNVADVEMQERIEQGMWRNRIAFIGIGCIGLALWIVTPSHNRRIEIRNGLAALILTYLVFIAFSLLWSLEPSITARRLVTVACSFVGALGLAYAFTPKDVCVFAFVFTSISVTLGLLAEFAFGTFTPWSAEYRFAGLVHPNTQAIELSVLILCCITLGHRYPRSRAILFWVAVVAGLLVLLTKSRTGAACLVVSCFSLWIISASRRAKLVSCALGMLSLGLIMAALFSLGIDNPDSFANAALLGRDDDTSTLTGRIPLWTIVTEEIGNRPLLGYGFGAYWDPDRMAYLSEELEWAVPNAHNAYLETVLNSGVVGLVMVLGIVFLSLLSLVRASKTDNCHSLIFALIVFGSLNGMFESHMTENFNFAPFLASVGICQVAFCLPLATSMSQTDISAQNRQSDSLRKQHRTTPTAST